LGNSPLALRLLKNPDNHEDKLLANILMPSVFYAIFAKIAVLVF